jgi:hypothetical protein
MPPKLKRQASVLNPVAIFRAFFFTKKAEEVFKTKAEAAKAKVAIQRAKAKKRAEGIGSLDILTGAMKEELRNATIPEHVRDGLKGRQKRDPHTGDLSLWPPMKVRIEVDVATNKAKEIVEQASDREEFKFMYNSGLYSFMTNTRLRIWWQEYGAEQTHKKRGICGKIAKAYRDWSRSRKDMEPWLFKRTFPQLARTLRTVAFAPVLSLAFTQPERPFATFALLCPTHRLNYPCR